MRGMIVAPEPLAVQAGADIMARGGNVFDAAVAAAFAQGVTNPMLCGIGGSGLLFLHHGPSRETLLIDCSCTMGSLPPPAAWASAPPDGVDGRYGLAGAENQIGYRSIMVPGVVKGAWEAYRRFGSGKVSWAELVEPARILAKEGFLVEKYLAEQWQDAEGKPGAPGLAHKWQDQREAQALFGRPRRVGERLVQEDYSRTLHRIAVDGGDNFYRGTLSEDISLDMEENGGLFTGDDLRRYEAADVAPLYGSYRGYEIRAAVSGSSSSPQVLATLQILEGFDLSGWDPSSPEYIDMLSRAMRAGFADHIQLHGDPPFSVALRLLACFTSRDRARYWQERITAEKSQGAVGVAGVSPSATHISAVGDDGSAVCFTHSIGAVGASGVITPGLGFLYNNFVGQFNPRPGRWDSIAQGKRGGGGAPLLLFKNGKLALIIGAPSGNRNCTAVLQTIVNVVDHGMSIQAAVSAPRFHSEEDGIIQVEPAIPETTIRSLQALGYRVENPAAPGLGCVQAIWLDLETGRPDAGTDPRLGGKALQA